jgi:dihydroorotate dehydrogenase electron transfer subunit
MIDEKVKIKEVRDLGSDNYLLALNSPEQARLTQPGQFVMLKCVEEVNESPLLRRPFTIFNIRSHARSGRPSGLELLVKDVGVGTSRLARLRPGQTIYCMGPLGRGFHIPTEIPRHMETAYLVAGGVGIAALLLLAQALAARTIRPILFYGGKSKNDLILCEYFERLGIEIHCVTEDGSSGERGLVTEALSAFLRAHPRKPGRIYACGPWGMMRAAHEVSQQFKLPCEVSLEARMGCALGACLGCVIHGWDAQGEEQYIRVCQDGPVMLSSAVDWDTVPI